jgi:hypothetical protein
LRTEPTANDVRDYGVKMGIERMPELRQKMSHIIDSYPTYSGETRQTSSPPGAVDGSCRR